MGLNNSASERLWPASESRSDALLKQTIALQGVNQQPWPGVTCSNKNIAVAERPRPTNSINSKWQHKNK